MVQVQVFELVVTLFLAFEGGHLCLELFMFLGVPLGHCADICDRIHQLCHIGFIVIIFRLFLILVVEVVHRGGFLESVASV